MHIGPHNPKSLMNSAGDRGVLSGGCPELGRNVWLGSHGFQDVRGRLCGGERGKELRLKATGVALAGSQVSYYRPVTGSERQF